MFRVEGLRLRFSGLVGFGVGGLRLKVSTLVLWPGV